jgi:Zn-dependent protease with chaperone function
MAIIYGHHPGNARLVVTSGLLEILDEEELRAVVGHELGHVLHWDILIMTLASLAPIILYYLYRFLINARTRGKGNPLPLVALLCYVFYLISQYLVLFLSGAREYYADRFSGRITKDPNALARALVKIAYGLAAARREEAEEKARSPVRAIAPLGIFDPHAALHLAVASGGGEGFSRGDMVGAMQWDLWNPWAGFYELASTHPLPAKRIKALGDLASHYDQQPLVSFNAAKPESYWDEFFVDLLVMALPILLPLVALAFTGSSLVRNPGWAVGLALAAFGLGSLIRTLFAYRGGLFPEVSVASILKKVKVSAIRSHPVTPASSSSTTASPCESSTSGLACSGRPVSSGRTWSSRAGTGGPRCRTSR